VTPRSVLSTSGVAAESVLLLVAAGLALQAVPFRVVAPLLGRRCSRFPICTSSVDLATTHHVRRTLNRVARHLPWRPRCFSRAIAAKLILRRRGISSVLCLGIRRCGDKIEAHAWVLAGAVVVTGRDSLEEFTPIAWFT
jgi:hypothetical protein